MRERSISDFGLLIAYVIPGFLGLWGLSPLFPELQTWLGSAERDAPTLAGFLYVTLASIALGVALSTVRWLLVDSLHHATGLRPGLRDFSALGAEVAGFERLVEDHYRYYQHYANSAVALMLVLISRNVNQNVEAWTFNRTDLLLVGICILYLCGSRDALKKYYVRTGQLLARSGSNQNKA